MSMSVFCISYVIVWSVKYHNVMSPVVIVRSQSVVDNYCLRLKTISLRLNTLFDIPEKFCHRVRSRKIVLVTIISLLWASSTLHKNLISVKTSVSTGKFENKN